MPGHARAEAGAQFLNSRDRFYYNFQEKSRCTRLNNANNNYCIDLLMLNNNNHYHWSPPLSTARLAYPPLWGESQLAIPCWAASAHSPRARPTAVRTLHIHGVPDYGGNISPLPRFRPTNTSSTAAPSRPETYFSKNLREHICSHCSYVDAALVLRHERCPHKTEVGTAP